MVAMLCIFNGCNHDSEMKQVVFDIRARMLPPGASATSPKISQTNSSVVATWDMHTDLKPDNLKEWLSKELQSDFSKITASVDRVSFAKYEVGESKRLEIICTQEVDGHTTSHVRLTIEPD